MRNPLLLLLLVVAAPAAHAGPRSSASYAIATDTVDRGGGRTSSSSYANVASVATVAGRSSVTSPAETGRGGYVGQLTEVVSLAITSTAASIPQGTTDQLAGTATLDDGTTSALGGSDIAWGAVAYPFLSINPSGQLAAATNVYASPVGTVMGSHLGASGATTVQVNGPYAGGGIPDAWLLQYFGPPPSANASPVADADSTGQTNLFKYLAGVNPLDGSRFVLAIGKVAGQNGQKALQLTPVYSGRTYTLQTSPTLVNPAWATLTNQSSSDNGTTRTVTDFNSGSGPRFYRVLISLP